MGKPTDRSMSSELMIDNKQLDTGSKWD